MAFPITVSVNIGELYGGVEQTILINSGLLTLVGPNGSGKSQVLRAMKRSLQRHIEGKKVRLLTAGRLAPLENYRMDYDGQRGTPHYEDAHFGGSAHRNHRFQAETAYGDFHTLSIRPDLHIKVAERLRRLFKREVLIEYDAGNLKIKFARRDFYGEPYQSSREASGLLHLVTMLTSLYDNEIGALLLDEPEVSLHPQLQAFLLQEIWSVVGDPSEQAKKLVVLATHSTEMLNIAKPSDLPSIIFFSDANTPPVQLPSETGELQNSKIKSLLPRLGQVHKTAFFCSKPLLVEGPSDAIICGALDQLLSLHLNVGGSSILPIIGKGQMPVVVKLMRLLGKHPIVLADLDAVADGLELIHQFASLPIADKTAQERGHRDFIDLSNSVYQDFVQLVDSHWHDIAEKAILHPYWTMRDQSRNEKIAKRRAALAVLLSSTTEDMQSFPNTQQWSPMSTRLVTFLDVLESVGCFILRRGTIESYYRHVDTSTVVEKPSAAAEEADRMAEESENMLQNHYADIIRALRYASSAEEINEVEALLDLLLAVVAPLLGRLTATMLDAELTAIARQVLGDRATLFTISNSTVSGAISPSIRVELNSPILTIPGFPVEFNKGCNVNERVASLQHPDNSHLLERIGDRLYISRLSPDSK